MKKIKSIIKSVVSPKVMNKIIPVYGEILKVKANRRFRGIVRELKDTRNQKRIILIGTAIYGNIGDHAISIAEETFLNKEFPNIIKIEVPFSLYELESKTINKYINQKDVIIINGGGFLGTLWENGQLLVDDIIQKRPDNKIVIFPQTIFYKNGSEQTIEKHRGIIKNHRNLSIVVRDKKSLQQIQRYNFEFKKVLLTPDIVSYIEANKYNNSKGKIIFVLRKDHEKLENNRHVDRFKSFFLSIGYKNEDFIFTDSVVKENYDLYNREEVLDQYLAEIGQADFVISDRLHGMILAAICGIPVIALDNVSRKVFGAYEWLSVFPYVLYYEENNIEQKIKDILSTTSKFEYKPTQFREYHEKIKTLIADELKNN